MTPARDRDVGADLNQALRRVVGQHWRLIVSLLVVTLGVATLLGRGAEPTYTASARLILDTQDPESRAEAAGIADGAKAIVTSTSQIAAALRDAEVTGRDPQKVATHVSLRPLGSSAVLQLSVEDGSPRIAAAIANALARRLITTRLEITEGEAERVLTDLDRRIERVNERIAGLNARIDTLTVETAGASTAERANAARGRRDEAARARDFLAQQRVALESQRVQLFAADALHPKPSIIGRAGVPAHADPSRRAANLVLAALLALIVGVGIAGFVESFRPTLVGGDAVASELGVPLLGVMREDGGDARALADASGVAMRLGLAAKAAGLRDVSLLSVGRPTNVARMAERLTVAVGVGGATEASSATDKDAGAGGDQEWLGETSGTPASGASTTAARGRTGRARRSALRIRPFEAQNPSLSNGVTTGLALVAPSTVKKAKLSDAAHLLAVSPFPVLGLIVHEPARASRRRGTATRRGGPGATPGGDSGGIRSAMRSFEANVESLRNRFESRDTTDRTGDR